MLQSASYAQIAHLCVGRGPIWHAATVVQNGGYFVDLGSADNTERDRWAAPRARTEGRPRDPGSGQNAKCLASADIGGYARAMEISPNRGNFPRSRVQVSDTLNPHGCSFPGMPDCHPGAGFRQRRATGGSVSLPPSGKGFSAGFSLLSQ
jgi:hypothetical protein